MITLPSGYPTDLVAAFDLLKTRKRLGLDELKVLALVESAGELLYQGLARGARNEEARKLLNRTGQEERGHAHRILKALQLLSGETMELPTAADNPLAAAVPHEIPLSASFLDMLEKAEFDGDGHYQAWAAAEPDARVASLLKQNGAEESRHGERARQVRGLEGFG